MNFLHRLLDPHRRIKPLPPPHPSARVLTFAESVLLHRNAEQSREQSRNFHTTNARSTA